MSCERKSKIKIVKVLTALFTSSAISEIGARVNDGYYQYDLVRGLRSDVTAMDPVGFLFLFLFWKNITFWVSLAFSFYLIMRF